MAVVPRAGCEYDHKVRLPRHWCHGRHAIQVTSQGNKISKCGTHISLIDPIHISLIGPIDSKGGAEKLERRGRGSNGRCCGTEETEYILDWSIAGVRYGRAMGHHGADDF